MSLLSDLMQRVIALTNMLNAIGANSKTNEELPLFSPLDRTALVRGSKSGVSKTFTLQTLIDDIASELALGNVPVVFLPVDVDFTNTGQTAEKIRLKLNASSNYVLRQGTLYIPYVHRIVLSNGGGASIPGSGSSYTVITEYFMLVQGIEPNEDGIASIGTGGTEILTGGIRYFNTVDSRSFAPIDFNLGTIGSTAIDDAVDAVGPFSTPHGTTVLFLANQDGIDRIWLFRGLQQEVGVGRPPTSLADYRLFPSEGETDPAPTYQETKPQQGSSDVSSVVLFLDNHEKRFISMNNPFFQESFLTRRLALGGQTHCIIDTTGETVYPEVKNKWLIRMNQTSGTANIVIDSNNYLIEHIDDSEFEAIFVADNAADILSDTGVSVIYNPDGFLEFDGSGAHTVSITNLSGTLNGTVKAVAAVMVNTPEFSEGLFDMFTEYNGYQISYRFSPRVVNGFNGFILKRYDDIDELKSMQSTQRKQAFYLVSDASDDPNLTFGVGETKLQAVYRWLGTTNAEMTDYELMSAPYNIVGGGGGPDIDPDTDIYADVTDLIADQGAQIEGEEYFVTDATDFTTITAGGALVLYLDLGNGDETDYLILNNPGGGNLQNEINSATAKTTPVDADVMPILDSAASNVLKKVTWANIKATLKTYFDTLYKSVTSPQFEWGGNTTLASTHNNAMIFTVGYTTTINPDTQTYQTNFECFLDNTGSASTASIVCTSATGYTYSVNGATAVASGTFTLGAKKLCYITRKLNTNLIKINGDVT